MMGEAGRARQRPSTVLCTGRAWVPKSYHAGMHANFINWAAGWGGGMGMGVGGVKARGRSGTTTEISLSEIVCGSQSVSPIQVTITDHAS